MKKTKALMCKRICCFAICLLLLSSLATLCSAADNGIQTVKVGFFAFDGYHMQDENGVRSGYGYELLQHLAGYAGLRYEYVGYDNSWGEMQDMLANGEIDLLTSAQKTPEREERFDFSSSNIGISAAILTTKAGDDSFAEADYKNWNGIRVGMIEDNSRNDSFRLFAQEHGFSFVPVYFGNTDEMIAELQSDRADKQIDAILTSNLRSIKNEWVIAQFDSSPFYIMVRKGNTALLTRINQALAQLDLYEPGLCTQLMNVYYTPDNGGEIAFTPEERAYIESMRGKSLTAILNPDCAPYSWFSDGAYQGILYDVAQLIVDRCGLSVSFLDARDREAYQRLVDENTVALRFDMDSSHSQAEKEQYWLTLPYMTVPLTRLYRENAKQLKTVALPANRSAADDLCFDINIAQSDIVYYNTIAAAVQAVMDGKQDMAYLAVDSAKMAVRDDVTNRLVSEELFGLQISYCVAVNYSQDPLLYSILTKAVNSLHAADIETVRQSYADRLEPTFSLIGYFYDYPMHALITVAALLIITIIIIVLFMQIKRRREALAHAKKDHAQNELLRDALAAAERAGTAKSQFLSRMSHEMRTPLNAIIGFIELAKDADSKQVSDYLASSDLAAKQLLNVINDVLDMSSIESGKIKIASAPFNFRHLISSITNIYGTQCKQKGISFETKMLSPIEDWIIGDELRVNQILTNLLSNAVKFTSEGHIWLTVSNLAPERNKLFLRFEIADTGCGISEDMKARIFQPFEQESADTVKKYGGSGLGLSIVKNLTSLMGGTVKVESERDRGTTFTVDLPFLRNHKEQQYALPGTVGELRILAVDDAPTERAYISSVLGRMGVRFTCVGSGSEALNALATSEKEGDLYNVCIIDWRMPGMDGVETTERIRRKYGKDVVVIIASAYDFHQAGESAEKAGANLFISKPIFQSSLFDTLMSLSGGTVARVKEEPVKWNFAGKRVLLVEDNALNQIVAKGFLSRFNVAVDLAADGQMAVEKFLSSEPGWYDAILMDIQMPVMDGYEATKAIRASGHPDAKTIQIIAQSADAFSEDIARSLSAGMNAHVAKPIEPDVLAKELYQAFSANAKNEAQ